MEYLPEVNFDEGESLSHIFQRERDGYFKATGVKLEEPRKHFITMSITTTKTAIWFSRSKSASPPFVFPVLIISSIY